MRSARALIIAATVLIALGVVSIALQPVLDPRPESVCVEDGQPSSGFVDDDKRDCNISVESYRDISDWNSKPKPLRIVGALLIVAGMAVGIAAAMRRRRRIGQQTELV